MTSLPSETPLLLLLLRRNAARLTWESMTASHTAPVPASVPLVSKFGRGCVSAPCWAELWPWAWAPSLSHLARVEGPCWAVSSLPRGSELWGRGMWWAGPVHRRLAPGRPGPTCSRQVGGAQGGLSGSGRSPRPHTGRRPPGGWGPGDTCERPSSCGQKGGPGVGLCPCPGPKARKQIG